MINFRNLILLFTLLSFNLIAQSVDSDEITSAELKQIIYYLASDSLKGRDTGSKEIHQAAEYIENEFKEDGLKPLFDNSYFQEFPFIAKIELTDNNSLSFKTGNSSVNPELKNEYITAPFSGNTNVKGDLVFAGFGISSTDLDYDDYANIDVKDKIVVVFRDHPDVKNPHSEFDPLSSMRKKAAVARDNGAVGIIFMNGFDEHKKDDDLVDFNYDYGGAITDFAVVDVKKDVITKLFKQAGIDLKDIYDRIVENKKPNSFSVKDCKVDLSTGVKEVEKISWNVGGYLEGNDPTLKNQYIVVGAHFDHLGMGGPNSLYRGSDPQIHNGADDNASGTAGVLELAEKFASIKDQLKRTMVFVTFSGEELGLLGSAYFVNHSPIPNEDVDVMVNMDMIGRLNNENSLIVYGTGTSSNWKEILNETNSDSLKLTFNDEGYGPSDQSSFYGKKIPVLFFFTGTHEDYHKPTDDADKINYPGEEKVVKYVYRVIEDIDNTQSKANYLLVEKKDEGQIPGRKVYVGTVPDFAGDADGYKISGVSDGSPAQIAGLQGGDIITQFGDKKISNIYDFTYALADYLPGDKVKVVVKRGNEEKTFEVELGSR
jgi:Peptidase family M28/PDZ domain/PA domain